MERRLAGMRSVSMEMCHSLVVVGLVFLETEKPAATRGRAGFYEVMRKAGALVNSL